MPLLEKAYAKVNVNYEMIGFGWMTESARILTGAPSYKFKTKSYTSSKLFQFLQECDKNKYIMTLASMRSWNGLA